MSTDVEMRGFSTEEEVIGKSSDAGVLGVSTDVEKGGFSADEEVIGMSFDGVMGMCEVSDSS